MTAEQIIQTICKPLADSPSLSNYIQMAQESLSSSFFGNQYEYAIAYKACHLFSMTDSNDSLNKIKDIGSGSIQSYSEGGMSISFGSASSDKELNSTKYGRMLLDLIKSRPTMNVNRNPLGSLIGGC